MCITTVFELVVIINVLKFGGRQGSLIYHIKVALGKKFRLVHALFKKLDGCIVRSSGSVVVQFFSDYS